MKETCRRGPIFVTARARSFHSTSSHEALPCLQARHHEPLCLWRGDERVPLARKAFDLLRYLVDQGKLVVAGQAYVDTGFGAALARYTSNGALDASFGNGGRAITNLGGPNDWMTSAAVLPDGRIVAAGQANVPGGAGFALARYETNGTLDTSFGTGGKVGTNFGGTNEAVRAVAAQPDGKIVTAEGGALARYN